MTFFSLTPEFHPHLAGITWHFISKFLFFCVYHLITGINSWLFLISCHSLMLLLFLLSNCSRFGQKLQTGFGVLVTWFFLFSPALPWYLLIWFCLPQIRVLTVNSSHTAVPKGPTEVLVWTLVIILHNLLLMLVFVFQLFSLSQLGGLEGLSSSRFLNLLFLIFFSWKTSEPKLWILCKVEVNGLWVADCPKQISLRKGT